jgi:hypothetical protein
MTDIENSFGYSVKKETNLYTGVNKMTFETKKQLMDRARYTAGLINVLKCDIDILRKDAAEYRISKVVESVREAEKTVQKLQLVIGEIEYILKSVKSEGS